jgi:hypothetical protein
MRRGGHTGHGQQVFLAVERQIGLGRDADGQTVLREQQGVPVAQAFRHGVSSNIARSPGPVVHHNRLLPHFSQALRHDPPHQVGRTAGAIANQHLDRLVRKGICQHRKGCDTQAQGRSERHEKRSEGSHKESC